MLRPHSAALATILAVVFLHGCSSFKLGVNAKDESNSAGKEGKGEQPEPPEEPEADDGIADVPVWVNASYLTCALGEEEGDRVHVRCHFKDENGGIAEWLGPPPIWRLEEGLEHEVLPYDGEGVGFHFLAKPSAVANGGLNVTFETTTDEEILVAAKFIETVPDWRDRPGMEKCLLTAEDPLVCLTEDLPSLDALTSGKRLLFATSSLHPGNLGGLDGADEICADAGKTVAEGLKWMALIGTSAITIEEQLPPQDSAIANTRGDTLYDDLQALLAGDPKELIYTNPDESGSSKGVWDGHWVGVVADGSPAPHCQGWTSADSQKTGSVGVLGLKLGPDGSCSEEKRVLCLSSIQP